MCLRTDCLVSPSRLPRILDAAHGRMDKPSCANVTPCFRTAFHPLPTGPFSHREGHMRPVEPKLEQVSVQAMLRQGYDRSLFSCNVSVVSAPWEDQAKVNIPGVAREAQAELRQTPRAQRR